MKAGKFSVSVQHGGGHHYFIWTGDDANEGLKIAGEKHKLLLAKPPKGPKPSVHVWGKISNV